MSAPHEEQQRPSVPDDGTGGPHAGAEKDQEGSQEAMKMKVCCVCGSTALYTCPGCARRTCSITCVRVHKEDFGCSGERDIAQKVTLSEFTDTQLQRDYHFLENCQRVIANTERSLPHFWRYNFKALPPPIFSLREAAKKRGVVCQIMSEGMQKRDLNTSRFDRKTNTIVWRCQFTFIDSASASFAVATDWGCERHHLGDIMKFCWATNPPLPCYHITKTYNRASRYVARPPQDERAGGGTDKAAPDASAEPPEAPQGEPQPSEGASHEESGAPADAAVTPPPGHVQERPPAPHELFTTDALPDVSVDPLTEEERQNERRVRAFTSGKKCFILSKAERLGLVNKYFVLDPNKTLNENLRLVFFVNEFPEFIVVSEDSFDKYPLISNDEKMQLRMSFKAKPKEPKPRLKKSDLSEEDQQRYARVPCRNYLYGRCDLEEACPYMHCEKEDVPLCKSFLKGNCPKGNRCSFRHDPTEEELAAQQRPMKRRRF
ncbi:hypothetical protein STCU_07368 [Strigomonas culicis]|uniref:HIT-type domain-containing protein n=1 Tax=Strigomonas culicis TaxID=28005 RepID=S9U4W8_9TRYP|nr:hypothetical protein STCU_08503 [Strigomonas culicis]EPY23988.1 hypothetical protein STCU_07368 [Strigomonas culicis]|eukprot:EPY21759.1 hypothetical protein STCU_08503 [Strigomonas culicis]